MIAALVALVYIRSAFVVDFVEHQVYLAADHAVVTYGVSVIYGDVWYSREWEWTDVLASTDASAVAQQISRPWTYSSQRIKRRFSFADLIQFHFHHGELDLRPSDVIPGAPDHEAKMRFAGGQFALWPLFLLSLIAPLARFIFFKPPSALRR